MGSVPQIFDPAEMVEDLGQNDKEKKQTHVIPHNFTNDSMKGPGSDGAISTTLHQRETPRLASSGAPKVG